MNAKMPSLTLGQRALLDFSSPWRRAAGVVVALGASVGATYLGSAAGEDSLLRFVPLWFVYLAILVMAVLYTHGAGPGRGHGGPAMTAPPARAGSTTDQQ